MIPLGIIAEQRRHDSGGGDWAPSDLTGLSHWVEVGDIGDFYQDSSKTTAVTGNGDPVGAWVDLSGNGNDFLQSTSGNRPEYQGSYVRGDGVSEYLISPSWTETDEWIIGLKVTINDTGATQGIAQFASTAGSGTPSVLVQSNGSTQLRIFVDGNYRWTITVSTGSTYRIVLRKTKPASNYLYDLWVDGTKQTQYDAGTSLSYSGTYWYLLHGFSTPGQHDYYGFICSEGDHSDTDATDIDTYLSGL